jgi:hypothetical protein
MTPGQDRFGHGLAFHAGIGRTLLFAGPGWRYDTWIYGNLVPASVQTFGAGCAGSIGVPDLQIGDPYVGNPLLAFDLMDVQPAAACLFGVDFATQSLPLGGGCTAWLQNPALYFVPANTCGCASLRLAIPRATGLRGAVFYAQAATLDVLGPANGLALSAARRLTLGD